MPFTPFQNESYVDFSQPEPTSKMRAAITKVRSELGKKYPVIIGDDIVATTESIISTNPARPSEVVGEVGRATPVMAIKALSVATETFKTWSRVEPEARARILVKAAAIMRRRIYDLSAWMVFEAGKTWLEAYADTAEAIDFLEFYAREMVRIAGSHPTTPYDGEENEVRYISMGPTVVIAPWNFPLAILAGMTTAAMVTGNTVVMKPAEQTPIIAAKLFAILQEAGMPSGVVSFLPGMGEDVGASLVESPQTRIIAFTGSKDVGVHINEVASKHQQGQKWIKRAILEMGGKDCVAVDEGVDLDEAAAGSVASAFGFQGQKCSAGSRLIVHEKAYDAILGRVTDKVKRLRVGDPTADNVDMGAVIDKEAFEKINKYIEIGKGEGKLLVQGETPGGVGYFIPPTVFADVDRNARIAQEEIFGPVLAITKAKDFDDLLAIANGTDYGLTGALYSNNRSHLERARHEFNVGNLYLNRKCTGALVDVQPFGGFNLSGTDSKAGGRDYLQLFMLGKSVAERW